MFAESALLQCSARTCLFRDFPQAFLVLHGDVSLIYRNLTGPKNFHTIFQVSFMDLHEFFESSELNCHYMSFTS